MGRVHPHIDQQQSRVSLDARPHRLQQAEIVSDGQHVDRIGDNQHVMAVGQRVREEVALDDAHPRALRLAGKTRTGDCARARKLE